MTIRKNAEAVFLAAAIVGAFVSYAMAAEPARFGTAPRVAKAVASDAAMQVVVILGRRLSAIEKAALN